MSDDVKASVPEPAPEDGDWSVADNLKAWIVSPAHSGLGIDDAGLALDLVKERDAFGREKYGTTLMTHNGRDCIEDARQEMGDLMMYVAQAKMEGRDLDEVRRLHKVLGELMEAQ